MSAAATRDSPERPEAMPGGACNPPAIQAPSALMFLLWQPTGDRRKIRHDLSLDAGVDDAVVRDDRARLAGLDGEAAARVHDAGVEGPVVGDDVVDQLIGVVNGDGLAGPRVNCGGYEDVMLQHPIGDRAAATAEVQVGAEDVVPL